MKTSHTTPRLSKPAMDWWPHIAIAIGLVVLMVWVLGDSINDFENNSWGLSTRFTDNRQIAAVFWIKIIGICFVGVGTIKIGMFFVHHISSRILNSLVLTTLVGVAGAFIVVYADAFKTFGLIETGNQRAVIHDTGIAVYFSLITWTTVGYGDFIPTEWARFFRQRRP